MAIHFLRPQQVAGFPVEYHEATPEIGGIDVIVWRDARRNDGFKIHCRDWGRVHQVLTTIKGAMEGRA